MYNENTMHITKCANGWILQLPERRADLGEAMIRQMPDIIRNFHSADRDPMLQTDNEQMNLYTALPTIPISMTTLIFTTFKKMMLWIDENHDIKE